MVLQINIDCSVRDNVLIIMYDDDIADVADADAAIFWISKISSNPNILNGEVVVELTCE